MADAGLADNAHILRPTGDMNVGLNTANCCVDGILYARIHGWINFSDLIPVGSHPCTIPIYHFMKLPQFTYTILNGNNQEVSVKIV